MKRLLLALLIFGILGGTLTACVAVPREQLAGAPGGTLTAVSAQIGGGFGSTGCTLSSAGAISCDGAATFGTFANLTKAAVITVTADSTITLTSGFQPLAAAGEVGTATIVGCNASGRISVLYNGVNQTITLTDTGTLLLAGNFGMTQYDTLTLLGDGTNCVEVARSVN